MRRPGDWDGNVQCGRGEGDGKPRLWQDIGATISKSVYLVIELMLDFHLSDSYVSFLGLFQTLRVLSYYLMPPPPQNPTYKRFCLKPTGTRMIIWSPKQCRETLLPAWPRCLRRVPQGFQCPLLRARSRLSYDSGPWPWVNPDAHALLADSDLSRYRWGKPLLLGRWESFSPGKACLRTDRASVYGLCSWQWEE